MYSAAELHKTISSDAHAAGAKIPAVQRHDRLQEQTWRRRGSFSLKLLCFSSKLLGRFRDRLADFLMRFGQHLHLHVRRNFAVQLDGHRVVADALERL